MHKVAAFDLGGGSTQVTYMPDDREIFATHPQYERTLNFFERDLNLFTHRLDFFAISTFFLSWSHGLTVIFSFLGNGLVSARFGVLSKSTSDKGKVCAPVTLTCHGYFLKEERHLTTPCLPPGFNVLEWEYILDKHNIRYPLKH